VCGGGRDDGERGLADWMLGMKVYVCMVEVCRISCMSCVWCKFEAGVGVSMCK
jgi:hypothetical protein